jgi:hypothetical protein
MRMRSNACAKSKLREKKTTKDTERVLGYCNKPTNRPRRNKAKE